MCNIWLGSQFSYDYVIPSLPQQRAGRSFFCSPWLQPLTGIFVQGPTAMETGPSGGVVIEEEEEEEGPGPVQEASDMDTTGRSSEPAEPPAGTFE